MKFILSLIILLLFSGCAFSPYTGIFASATTSSHSTEQVILTDTIDIKATKRGEATCHNILGLVAFGDCSIESASKEGGIERIKSAVSKKFSVLGIYSSITTIVEGE